MRRDLVRRVDALEQDANPAISTWADLMTAVAEGQDSSILSPAMQELVDSALDEEDRAL